MFKTIRKTIIAILAITLSIQAFSGAFSFQLSTSPYKDNGKATFNFIEKRRTDEFEIYSELDKYGRCGVAYANISTWSMPKEERGSIGMIKPADWQNPQSKYDFIEGKYLYNRCHLIAYELAGKNDNEKNLITGTRYMNIKGMLPFENKVAKYVKETSNHCLYKVMSIYKNDNLLCDGVRIEAYSVEDKGKGINFNVFCYNIQPAVNINYKTGENQISNEEKECQVTRKKNRKK